MNHVKKTQFIDQLDEYLDRLCDNSEPVHIDLPNGRSAVLMSQSDFDSLQETLHLLSSPKNAERLLASIAEIEAGNAKQRDLP